MKGFKEFLFRGNLVELAIAVIIGTTFAAVVKAFTDIVLDLIGRIIGTDDFSNAVVSGVNLGPFLSATLTFVLTAAVLYFFVIVPVNKLAAMRKAEEPEAAATSEEILGEIRDLLRDQQNRA